MKRPPIESKKNREEKRRLRERIEGVENIVHLQNLSAGATSSLRKAMRAARKNPQTRIPQKPVYMHRTARLVHEAHVRNIIIARGMIPDGKND